MENTLITPNSTIVRLCENTFNKALKKALDNLKECQYKWGEAIDLKLHDASYVDTIEVDGATIKLDNDKASDLFCWFCDDSYTFFKEDLLEEKGIDFEEFIGRVGRTSKFFVGGGNYDYAPFDILCEFCYDLSTSSIGIDTGSFEIDRNTSIEWFEDIEDYCNELICLTEAIEEDTANFIDKVNYVWDYIDDFKKNQVENFKEFCLNNLRETI
jgi:hypothetical protein